MSRQRNTSQLKEQDKITAEKLNETEISSMPHKQLIVMVIKIFTALEKKVDELSENLNKEI